MHTAKHKLVALALTALLVCACSGLESFFVEEPIAAGIDSPDKDVSEHLRKVLQAARVLPKSASMRGRLGMAYDVNGLRDAALVTYEQAEALDPTDFRWPYFSAHLSAETGEHQRALEALQRALVIDADYPPAWLWRGTWLLDAGRPDEALIAFEQAATLDAGPVATFGRARVMIARGRHQQAIELLEPLTKSVNHPFIHRTLGEALRAVGRIEEARMAMARGKDALPISWPDERRDQRNVHVRGYASYEFAKNLSASGRMKEALTILKRLQGHHPETKCGQEEEFFLACNLMNSTSIAHDRRGYPDRAFETVRRGLGLNPEFIPFHLTIANLYRHQADLESALSHLEQAIVLNPARGFAHEQRGRLLFGLARYEDARVAFESALRYEPEKQTTLFYLGLVEVEFKNWHAALARFASVVRLEPSFALGHAFLARSFMELGRIDDARLAQNDARRYGAQAADLRTTEIRLRQLEAR